MLGIGPVEIGPVTMAIGLVVLFLLEVVVFWAASAVADAPPMGWGKLFLVVFLVTILSVALTAGIGIYSGAMKAPFEPDNRPLALITAGLVLVVLWAIPAVIYPILASVSILRGMWLSLLQLLLRGFLYVFIVALVMVVLAVIQIIKGTDPRAELFDFVGQVPALVVLL